MEQQQWVKSSFCNGGGCVEVARTEEGVLVRDEKKVVMALTHAAWAEIVADVKADKLGLIITQPAGRPAR